MVRKNKQKKIKERIIFSADRDNNDKGIPLEKLIKILKKIDSLS